jgi:hypothetical protein
MILAKTYGLEEFSEKFPSAEEAVSWILTNWYEPGFLGAEVIQLANKAPGNENIENVIFSRAAIEEMQEIIFSRGVKMGRMNKLSKSNVLTADKAILQAQEGGVIVLLEREGQRVPVSNNVEPVLYKTALLAQRALKRLNPDLKISSF